ITADVFVSITPGPMQILKDAGLIDNAVPVASTSMVIAYSPESKFSHQFSQSRGSNADWLKVLASPGLKFGRTDPLNDPKGQNIIFTLLLAEKYYREPGLSSEILGGYQNPAQTYLEGGLLARLESGQVDAAAGYESEVISSHLPYVALPDEINLSNPAMAKQWYDTVSFSVKDSPGKHPHPHYCFISLALTTAMRQGEILSLRWEHIDLQHGVAHLPVTKNGSVRDVPLSRRARQLLQQLSVRLSGPVFHYKSSGFKSAWRAALQHLKIENLHFHDLRHEAISRLFELGTLKCHGSGGNIGAQVPEHAEALHAPAGVSAGQQTGRPSPAVAEDCDVFCALPG
ncbi:tyrosine-type recombinase/integrase, partial [Salmonella enterica]|nr:tyrosine-type recombinase/integrase [Salmonella enterica]